MCWVGSVCRVPGGPLQVATRRKATNNQTAGRTTDLQPRAVHALIASYVVVGPSPDILTRRRRVHFPARSNYRSSRTCLHLSTSSGGKATLAPWSTLGATTSNHFRFNNIWTLRSQQPDIATQRSYLHKFNSTSNLVIWRIHCTIYGCWKIGASHNDVILGLSSWNDLFHWCAKPHLVKLTAKLLTF